jgi:FMN-dependent NADH-azoreductase
MPTLLHITVSPRGDHSISRRFSDSAVTARKARNPEGRAEQVPWRKAESRLRIFLHPI